MERRDDKITFIYIKNFFKFLFLFLYLYFEGRLHDGSENQNNDDGDDLGMTPIGMLCSQKTGIGS